MEILQLTIQFLVIHYETIQRNVIVGEVMLPLVNYEFVDEEIAISQNLKAYKPQPVSEGKRGGKGGREGKGVLVQNNCLTCMLSSNFRYLASYKFLFVISLWLISYL